MAVMILRYSSNFIVEWMTAILQNSYEKTLKLSAFEAVLGAKVEYFDIKGDDQLLNAVVTQSNNATDVLRKTIYFIRAAITSLSYLCVSLYIAPILTLLSIILLGSITYIIRFVVEPGYDIGDRTAEAYESVQTAAQAGIEGIRDVKSFDIISDKYDEFVEATNNLVTARVQLSRNASAINNFYQMANSVTIFILIFIALRYTALTLEEMGVFLFAMYRLAPQASQLNNIYYDLEGKLPHLVRTEEFLSELRQHREPNHSVNECPDGVNRFDFDNVTFGYKTDEPVLRDVSFEFTKNDFVAFVGPSGAGKSTIISLLARMYEPNEGEILADGESIDKWPIDQWRQNVALVRQDPHIFNDTLRENIALADPDATMEEIARVCEISQVSEFLEELPEKYDTELGDDGVRLSGGQRQRIALARALLKDAELLLLDEATSDLDSNIELKIQNALESMDRSSGLVVVAHRLSTVQNADCIYALDSGRIVESGTHDELIEADGLYAEMCRTQSHSTTAEGIES